MQPAPAPPLPREAAAARTVRPSAWWFLAAGLVAVAGIVVGIVGAVRTFGDWLDRVDGLERTSVPGSMTVEIDEPGGYSIYVESERRTADPELLDNPVVDVLDPSGDFVPLDPYGSSVTYTTPSHRGRGAFTFQAEEPGTYEVTASGSSGTVVAVGRGIGDLLVSGLGRSVAVGLLGPLVGGATALVVGVRRSRDRRRLLSTPAPYAGAYGGYSPPPGFGPPPPPTPPTPPPPPPPGFGPPPPPPPGESRFARTAPPGAADPPSLRARVDWSSGDVPLPWRSERP